MQETIEKFLNKLRKDKAFAEKILAQTEKEKVIVLAKEEGIILTMENIDEVNEILTKAMQKRNDGELSEEELEHVAGGFFSMTPSIIIDFITNLTRNDPSFISKDNITTIKEGIELVNGKDE